MMSQKRGLDQWVSNQFCKFDDMIDHGADLFRWLETRFNTETSTLNNLNKFEKLISSKPQFQNWTESCEEVQ